MNVIHKTITASHIIVVGDTSGNWEDCGDVGGVCGVGSCGNVVPMSAVAVMVYGDDICYR
jgi:hypothetical protein